MRDPGLGAAPTLEDAHAELLAACSVLEFEMMSAEWRLDATLVLDAARVACAARDCLTIGHLARDPKGYVERWTRVLRAAEDVALIALTQIVAARDHIDGAATGARA